MSWRFQLQRKSHSFTYPNEDDDEKEKLWPELDDTQYGEAGGLQKKVRAAAPAAARSSAVLGSVSSRGWTFFSGFRGRGKVSTSNGYVVAEKYLRQECCPKLTSGGGVAGSVEVTSKKPFRQELGHLLGIQAYLSDASANAKCCVDVNGDELPSFGCGPALLLVRVFLCIGNRLICCMLPRSTSAVGDDVDRDEETELDHQKPDEVHLQRRCIQLKTIISDDLSNFGEGQVRADSTFFSTFLHEIDQNSIFNSHVETAPSADITIESEVDVATVERPEQVLGGMSRFEYEHIVFQVCPSLPSIDIDFERNMGAAI